MESIRKDEQHDHDQRVGPTSGAWLFPLSADDGTTTDCSSYVRSTNLYVNSYNMYRKTIDLCHSVDCASELNT